MSEINVTGVKFQSYLLKFDGVTCPGCVSAIKKSVSQLDKTIFIEISEINGDALIKSSLMPEQINLELFEFEGCCSDCQITIGKVVETDLETFNSLIISQDNFGLVKKQYKQALERAINGVEVSCSENCVCKNTDVDRLLESSGAPSFASVYNLSNRIQSNLKLGMMVTDFGCGTGHDAMRVAKIVDPGIVTGIDVTPEMVEFASKQAKQGGINNAKFLESHDLSPIENNSQDIIYVNNVLNLLNDKPLFIQNAFEKLKTHGILIIADEFALEVFPTDLRNDESFQCGGISGAELVEDIEAIALGVGFNILNWELIKEYSIEFMKNKYLLNTSILKLEKN